MTYFVTNIEKVGSVIMITLDNGKTVTYDCKENIMTSYTNRKVKNFPSNIDILTNAVAGLKWALTILHNYHNNSTPETFKKLELFINNLDLIETPFNDYIPNECPKGYIKYLRDNNKKINCKSLMIYKASKTLNKNDLTIYSHLIEADTLAADWYINLLSDNRNKFNKIFNVSAKEFNWNLQTDFHLWYNTCIYNAKEKLGDNWMNFLDENRNFKYNTKIIETLLENKRNEKIIKNESKIKAIENLSNDTYIIKVPEKIIDFTEEGKMQNNCVGSYYHESIANGENLIYFIRLTKKPEKSYITNRYRISSEKTIESRKINNTENNDIQAKELIKQIDKMIKELLK